MINMNSFHEWLALERQDAAAQTTPSDDFWSDFGRETEAQPTAGIDGFHEWLRQETEAPGFMAPRNVTTESAPQTSTSTDFHRWLEAERSQPQPRSPRDTMALPRDWYVPPAPRQRAERERRRILPIAVAAGAAALGVTLVASALVGPRGHVDANPSEGASPSPSASSMGHPKWWRQILHGKTLNMANAAFDAAHEVPGAVEGAKGSTEEIINYTNPDGSGHIRETQGTAYVAIGPDGKPHVYTAAHCVYGGLDGSAPNFLLQTNSGGKLHQDFFIDLEVPKSFDMSTDTEIGAPSDDIAQGNVMPTYWYDVNGRIQSGENGITSIHPLQIAAGKAAVGTLVFTWGYRPVNGEELTPPQSPVLQPMVVAGYADNGNRELLIPVEQRDPQQNQGNSGSALLDGSGDVEATLIAGGDMPAGKIKSLTGLKVVGGDGEQIDQSAIPLEVGEVDNTSNLAQVSSGNLLEPNIPKVTPRVIYAPQ